MIVVPNEFIMKAVLNRLLIRCNFTKHIKNKTICKNSKNQLCSTVSCFKYVSKSSWNEIIFIINIHWIVQMVHLVPDTCQEVWRSDTD